MSLKIHFVFFDFIVVARIFLVSLRQINQRYLSSTADLATFSAFYILCRRLLEASNIPFKIRQIPHWNKLSVEIEEHSVYISRLTNMGLVGDDCNNITAFEIIKEAYESVIKYYQRKDENSLHYQKNTGEKCFSITFDSFYLESFSEFKRVEEIGPEQKNEIIAEIADEEYEIADEECEIVDDQFEIADEEFEISRGEEESFSDVTTSDQNVIPSDEDVASEES